MTDPVESLARTVAETAHEGQVDKAGEPYIEHCRRVAERLDDPLDRAVAWLHDVVEDTGWTAGQLIEEGDHWRYLGEDATFETWRELISDVCCLTHRVRTNEPREDYYARVRTSERAVRVKLADIADNSDPDRLAVLDEATRERLEAKYAKAREALAP